MKFHFVIKFSIAKFMVLLFLARSWSSSISISLRRLLISILWIVSVIFFLSAMFSYSAVLFSSSNSSFSFARCFSSSISSISLDSSWEFLTLSLMRSSRFAASLVRMTSRSSLRSINSYSSLSFSSRTSLLLPSSKVIFSMSITPWAFK